MFSLNSNKILQSFAKGGSSILKNSSSNNKTKTYSFSLKAFSSNYNKPNNDSIENIMGENMQNNNYNSSNSNNSNYNNNSSNYNNNNNSNTGNYQSQNKNIKRNRLSFLRDGMLLTFYLRKNVSSDSSQKNEGYLYVELREFTENFDRNSKDPRFILLKGISLAKILLVSPKCFVENTSRLEKIGNLISKIFNLDMGSKFRSLVIQQTSENKYVLTLKILPKTDGDTSSSSNPNNNNNNEGSNASSSTQIVSQIELNPEDVVLLQKFVHMCIEELLNF